MRKKTAERIMDPITMEELSKKMINYVSVKQRA